MLCEDRFHRASDLRAARRAASLRGWGGDLVCGRHRARPPVYDRARAAARYSETMWALVQSFKYGDRHEGLKLFRRWLAKAGAELLDDADLIVPVPLYPTRLWWRRFNPVGHARARGGASRWHPSRSR